MGIRIDSRSIRAAGLILLTGGILPLTATAQAATLPDYARVCADVPCSVSNVYASDELAVSLGPLSAGVLFDAAAVGVPPHVQIDAFSVAANRIFFSTDLDMAVGGTFYADEDVAQYDVNAGTLTNFFRGADHGIPSSSDIDALHVILEESNVWVLVSIDTTRFIPGGDVVQDEDILVYTNGALADVFRGDALGIPGRADLDALYDSETNTYFSLDVPTRIGGDCGTDHDVWAVDKAATNTSLLGAITMAERVDLCGLDCPVDSDGDWLSDFEEASGTDEAASTFPGSAIPLSPNGFTSDSDVADSDGDGMTDGEEAACGTDPTDDTDLLRIASVEKLTATNVAVTWATVPGHAYALDRSDSLLTNFTVVLPWVGATAGTNRTTHMDTVSAGETQHFYSVRLEP